MKKTTEKDKARSVGRPRLKERTAPKTVSIMPTAENKIVKKYGSLTNCLKKVAEDLPDTKK